MHKLYGQITKCTNEWGKYTGLFILLSLTGFQLFSPRSQLINYLTPLEILFCTSIISPIKLFQLFQINVTNKLSGPHFGHLLSLQSLDRP
jgi:hypothetical protein